MAQYDLVIFGATGFTGQWVVREFSLFAENVKWAVCGRNEDRLNAIIKENNLSAEYLVADITDIESIDAVCRKTKLLVNCTGPYRLLGEAVFKSCITNGADYLDICGEPEFIEAMEMKYMEEARRTGSVAITGCGFDSIPSDIGLNYMKSNFGGRLQSVESFLKLEVGPGYSAHATTWDCAVMGIGNQDALKALRRINKRPRPDYESSPVRHRSFGAKISDVPAVTGRSIPFPGSDVSIVRRSQQLFSAINSDCPIRYSMYMVVESVYTVWSMAVAGLMLSLLSKFSMGQNLLMRFCKFFSFGAFTRAGPSSEAIEKTKFSIDMIGRGIDDNENDKCRHMQINGPEPGYDATSKILVCAIRTMLTERKLILSNLSGEGAVTTTAFAFQNTEITQKLIERGITFDMLN